MTASTVGRFDDPEGAIRAEATVQAAAREGLVEVVDHLVIRWPANADLDRLGDRFRGHDSRLISTNLTEAERENLLGTFGSG